MRLHLYHREVPPHPPWYPPLVCRPSRGLVVSFVLAASPSPIVIAEPCGRPFASRPINNPRRRQNSHAAECVADHPSDAPLPVGRPSGAPMPLGPPAGTTERCGPWPRASPPSWTPSTRRRPPAPPPPPPASPRRVPPPPQPTGLGRLPPTSPTAHSPGHPPMQSFSAFRHPVPISFPFHWETFNALTALRWRSLSLTCARQDSRPCCSPNRRRNTAKIIALLRFLHSRTHTHTHARTHARTRPGGGEGKRG